MDRKTIGITPESTEFLQFTPDEASIGIRAVAYYTATSLESLEANWPVQGYHAVDTTPARATERVNALAAFTSYNAALAAKFESAASQPNEPIELTPQEIMRFGEALFRFFHTGVKNAKKAIETGDVSWNNTQHQTAAGARIQQTADDTHDLFKSLEPIAKSKTDYRWMVWESGSGPVARQ